MLQFSQTQKQSLKIAPSQIQLLNFFHLSTIELEEYIKTEIEENPLLEEASEKQDDSDEEWSNLAVKEDNTQEFMDWDEFSGDDIPDYKTRISQSNESDDLYSPSLMQQSDWRAEIKEQLHLLLQTERQIFLADFITDLLTDDGYLLFSTESITDDISFKHNLFVEEAEVEEILVLLKKLSPAGIGTKNLQESLAVQLRRKYDAGEGIEDEMELALEIAGQYFDEISNHNYEKIMRDLSLSQAKLKSVLGIITALSPKPIREDASQSILVKNSIIPDYIIHYDNRTFEISLNNSRIPPLRINEGFSESIGASGDKKANVYIQNKINSANWLIDAIQQRENTMSKTMRVIVGMQQEFFKTGELRNLRPMTLKDVADKIQMDISTVSRVTSGKYAQTPFGTINLKSLFTGGLFHENGEEVSNKEVQNTLVEIVMGENKHEPYNDTQLVELLIQRGYTIARRTVAKYRENLGIENAVFRKTL